MAGQWGRAGVRLSESQQRQRQAALVRRRQVREDDQQRQHREAYEQWRAGRVVPNQITTALNARGLWGPDVDRQCHAKEPAVDEWEAGTRYPRWDQLEALARLTGYPARFFMLEIEPIPFDATSLGCRRSGGFSPPEAEPVMEFDPGAIEATVNPVQPGLF